MQILAAQELNRLVKDWVGIMRELSAALYVDFQIKLEQSDISEIERQKRGIKDFELDAIARLLGVTPEWLLRGEANSHE